MFIISLMLSLSALAADAYPVSYKSCGVDHSVSTGPKRVVTMNQGATEFMLALGLADKMVGTAYLDDYIWPKYATEYAKIPVIAKAYPNESTIMSVNPDFIVASYNSAFQEVYMKNDKQRGIFSEATVGPCSGEGSEWGVDTSGEAIKDTCRPQLHAKGIGTYLFADACEDKTLRPPSVTETTVYSEMRALGKVFKVDAESLITEMKADFDSAAAMMSSAMHDKSMKAVWLDCVGRCCKDDKGEPDPKQVFVGAAQGAPAMLMREAGLSNVFNNKEGNWACVNVSDVVASNPDVLVVVDADWDKALDKISWLYDHSDFCDTDMIKGARLVQIPFSATTLSPRNGPAALDLAIAALHVRLGALTAVRKSGVSSFLPSTLNEHTKGLKCSLVWTQVMYDKQVSDAPEPVEENSDDQPDTASEQSASDASKHSPMRTLALGLGFVIGLQMFVMMP